MDTSIQQGLFQALSNASDHVYLFMNDMKIDHSHWSDNAVWYFDMPEGYEDHTLPIWIEKIHPDDRNAYLDDINAVFSGTKARHQVQYRARNRYGDYVWLECTGNVIKDESGKPILFAGMITRLDSQTKYDPLTKLLSYHQFYLEEELPERSVVLLFGMDQFRKVIQNYGYEAGNQILQCMAQILTNVSASGRAYRMNGDEFLLVLPETTIESAQKIFREIRRKFQESLTQLGFSGMIQFSASGNITQPEKCDKETMLKQLEHSMEQAKQNGGGNLVFFSDQIEKIHKRAYKIGQELNSAISQNFKGFELYYQPIKSNNGSIQAVESLLRFQSDTLGQISPVEFIPILEANQSIRQVGIWVMKEAVSQCKKWNKTHPDISIAFNVSYLQLYNDDLVTQLIQETEQQGVDPGHIIVELTESCKVLYPESLKAMFQRLLQHGFRVALDDFGMEFSSLALLRDIPVSTVKIDHSFVRTLSADGSQGDRANCAIISGIITMCKEMNLRIVVEGVENQQIAAIISQMDVDYLQGYYYSKPVPAKEVEAFF